MEEYHLTNAITQEYLEEVKTKWIVLDCSEANIESPPGVCKIAKGWGVRHMIKGRRLSFGAYYTLERATEINDIVMKRLVSNDYNIDTFAEEIRNEYAYTHVNVTGMDKRRLNKSRYHVKARSSRVLQRIELKGGDKYVASLRHLGNMIYCGLWKNKQTALNSQRLVKQYLKSIGDPNEVDMKIVTNIIANLKDDERMGLKEYPREIGYIDSNKNSVYIVVGSKRWGTVDVLLDKEDALHIVMNSINIVRKSETRLVLKPAGVSIYVELF